MQADAVGPTEASDPRWGLQFPCRTVKGSWGWAGLSAILSGARAPEGSRFPAQAIRSHSCWSARGLAGGQGGPGEVPGCGLQAALCPGRRDPSSPHLSSDSNLQSSLGPGGLHRTPGWPRGTHPARVGLGHVLAGGPSQGLLLFRGPESAPRPAAQLPTGSCSLSPPSTPTPRSPRPWPSLELPEQDSDTALQLHPWPAG